MVTIGTPNTDNATRVLILGANEISKETALEAQRLGLEVIAVDGQEDAPAMQVAHRSHVIHMPHTTRASTHHRATDAFHKHWKRGVV